MRLSSQRKLFLLVLVPAIIALGLYTWVFHDAFAVRVPGAVDFYPRYAATQFVIEDGINPYTPEATDQIQTFVFGSPLPDSEYHAFAYPLYTIFFTAPLLLLPDYAWVQAVWQVLLQVMLVASTFLILRYFKWQPKPWMLALLLIYTLFSHASARALILGQFSTVVFFLTLLAFWFLFHGETAPTRDVIAGICLALSTIKPQLQFLIIPLLVLWGLRDKRWYFLGSAALSMVVLFGVSFVMLPSWLMNWIGQLTEYSGYTLPSIPQFISYKVTSLGSVGMWAIYLLLGGYLLVEWWRWLGSSDSQLRDWTLALTLVVSQILAPRVGTAHHVILLFALFPLLQQWDVRSPLIPVAVLIGLFVGYWWLFIATRDGQAEADIVYVLMPLITLALMLLGSSQRAFAARITKLDAAAEA